MQLFDLVEVGKGKFRGPQPDTQWQRLFGGQVMALMGMGAPVSVMATGG